VRLLGNKKNAEESLRDGGEKEMRWGAKGNMTYTGTGPEYEGD